MCAHSNNVEVICVAFVAMASLVNAGIASFQLIVRHRCAIDGGSKRGVRKHEPSNVEAEQHWPTLNKKSNFKLEVDPAKCLLCCNPHHVSSDKLEGTMCARMFECPPPGLEECLSVSD